MPKTVHISDALVQQHPVVAQRIKACCHEAGIPLVVVSGSKNIWIRDWGCIPGADGLIQFRYESISRDKYPHMYVPPECRAQLKGTPEDIVLDGGNVVQNRTHVFITEMVFEKNPTVERKVLLARLEHLFGKTLVILPVEPEDDLGHSDGIVLCKPDGAVLINDYSVMCAATWNAYDRKLRHVLDEAQLKWERLPYAYHRCPQMTAKEFRSRYPKADDQNPCHGYYVNALVVEKLVMFPMFGLPEDTDAWRAFIKHFPGYLVKPVYCYGVAMLGGAINCITADYDL